MSTQRFPITATAALLLVLANVACGPSVVVFDVFQADTAPPVDALHTYASHAQAPLRVRATGPFTSIDALSPRASGSISIDPATKVEVQSGVLDFAVLTGDAGAGTLTIVDGSSTVATETLTVDDADGIALSVTAPFSAGVDLPDVDPARVRIDASSRAGFRTTLTKGGDEIVGLRAVVATPSDAHVTAKNAAGCAQDTCAAQRNAVDIALAAGAVESDVALSAGNANLAVHVVPTDDTEVTDLVLDESTTPVNDRGSVVAHVLVGTEPLFGAPVAWTVDGHDLVDGKGNAEHGDAVQFDVPAPNTNPNFKQPTHALSASFAGQQSAVDVVASGNFAAGSITSDCASTSGACAPIAVLALLIARRKPPQKETAAPG